MESILNLLLAQPLVVSRVVSNLVSITPNSSLILGLLHSTYSHSPPPTTTSIMESLLNKTRPHLFCRPKVLSHVSVIFLSIRAAIIKREKKCNAAEQHLCFYFYRWQGRYSRGNYKYRTSMADRLFSRLIGTVETGSGIPRPKKLTGRQVRARRCSVTSSPPYNADRNMFESAASTGANKSSIPGVTPCKYVHWCWRTLVRPENADCDRRCFATNANLSTA